MTQAMATTRQTLRISQLVIDVNLHIRVVTDVRTYRDYARLMAEGAEFPPLGVVYVANRDKYYLYDGRHRREALLENKRTEAECEVTYGTWSDALLLAVKANAHHGRQMLEMDRRHAAAMLLEHPIYGNADEWSDRRLGKLLGVTHDVVGNLREELQGVKMPLYWSLRGKEDHVSTDDLSRLPNDVLAAIYTVLGEEIAGRQARADG